MASRQATATARRIAERVRRLLAEDLHRLREDAGLTRTALARAAGVDPTYLARLEDGVATPTLEIYARLASALGGDLAARVYPNTGPAIRDRHQARIVEALVSQLHPRWRAYPEVAVRRPARGWIDVVLHDAVAGVVVGVEVQSSLPRIEQLIRWSGEKVASLPSWDGFGRLGAITTTSQLLLIRSTRGTRDIGAQFQAHLAAVYPAHPADALESLRGARPWPGSALVWVDLRPDAVRFIARR